MVNNMQQLLDDIIMNNRHWTRHGRPANYIPELAKANPNALGISIVTVDGEEYHSGQWDMNFTIQSISKVISLMLVLSEQGEDYVFERVGTEPTGEGFNSIGQLERKNLQRPLNPMINAGAIAVVSMLDGETGEEKFEKLLDFIRRMADNPDINVNHDVYKSEKMTGDRNRALAYFMKSTGVLEGDAEKVLDAYFMQCAVNANCLDIARIGAVIANNGIVPWSNERLVSRKVARIVRTIMVTCGMYDASGEFAVHIGIPAKSGVGGGVMAVVPGRMGIGVMGPALDEKGNSIASMKVLQELSTLLELSIF